MEYTSEHLPQLTNSITDSSLATRDGKKSRVQYLDDYIQNKMGKRRAITWQKEQMTKLLLLLLLLFLLLSFLLFVVPTSAYYVQSARIDLEPET